MLLLVLVLLCIPLALCTAFAGKGENNAIKQVTEFNAGAVALGTDQDHGLASDGLGSYIDGAFGVECIHHLDTGTTRCSTGQRLVTIRLGNCISDQCDNPFQGGTVTTIAGQINQRQFYVEDHRGKLQGVWPAGGQTLVSDSNGGGLYFDFLFGGEQYWFKWTGPNGEIVASGYDDDGDAVLDRTVMTASSSATVFLYKIVYVTETKGKMTTTRRTSQTVGEFTGMPFQATFKVLDYTRPAPASLY